MPSRRLAALRLTATARIAGIAAWVSYWHMVEVAHDHDETADSAHLIPLSVDGLVVVASIWLVEVGAHLRALMSTVTEPTTPHPKQDRSSGQEAQTNGEVGSGPGVVPLEKKVDGHGSQHQVEATQHQQDPDENEPSAEQPAQRPGPAPRPSSDTARGVARLRRRHPDWTTAQIAARLNIHPSTVRRHLNAQQPSKRASTTASTTASATPSTDASTTTRTDASTPVSRDARSTRVE